MCHRVKMLSHCCCFSPDTEAEEGGDGGSEARAQRWFPQPAPGYWRHGLKKSISAATDDPERDPRQVHGKPIHPWEVVWADAEEETAGGEQTTPPLTHAVSVSWLLRRRHLAAA